MFSRRNGGSPPAPADMYLMGAEEVAPHRRGLIRPRNRETCVNATENKLLRQTSVQCSAVAVDKFEITEAGKKTIGPGKEKRKSWV